MNSSFYLHCYCFSFYKQKSQAYTELLVEEILANVAVHKIYLVFHTFVFLTLQMSFHLHFMIFCSFYYLFKLLLSQPRAWCIQFLSLLLRSQYERKSSRKKERSMVQLQVS